MRLQFCSSTGTPAAAPTTSQNNPRARKQPGTGAKHQPMTSHQFPQPPTPLSSNPSPQCRVQPPAVHQHVPPAVPRASRRAETFPRLPHRRVDPTSSGRPACTRPGPAIGRSPVLSSVMIPLIIFIFFYLPAIDCILSRQDFFFFASDRGPPQLTPSCDTTLSTPKNHKSISICCVALLGSYQPPRERKHVSTADSTDTMMDDAGSALGNQTNPRLRQHPRHLPSHYHHILPSSQGSILSIDAATPPPITITRRLFIPHKNVHTTSHHPPLISWPTTPSPPSCT